jgi:hypothetical protein
MLAPLDRWSVTVVIPSHRRGALIDATLASLARQSLSPDEVLIVNDGGYADTRTFVERHYPGYRVLDTPQQGAAMARNTGAAHASHPLLLLIDDDDTIRPEGLEILVGNLRRFPSAAASFGDHTFTDHVTGLHRPNHLEYIPRYKRTVGEPGDGALYGRALHRGLLHGNVLGQPWLIRKDVYLALGGFYPDLGSADDWDLYLRLTRHHPVVITSRIVSDHYREAGKVHLTTDSGQLEKQIAALVRELDRTSRLDMGACALLRRRLGITLKAIGDAETNPVAARRAYQQSARWWPFDHVVACRAIGWTLMALLKPSRAA